MSYFARNISSEELGRLLSAIEKSGVKFTNATPSYPEPSGWKTELPVSFSPFGKAFVLNSVDDIAGSLSLKFFDRPNIKLFEDILKQLSPYASVGFRVGLHPKTIPFEDLRSHLMFNEGKIFIALAGFKSICSNEIFTNQESLQNVIEIAKLPLSIIKESSGKFVFQHAQAGGELYFAPPTPDTIVSDPIYVTLPRLSLAEVVGQYCEFIHHPEFRSKGRGWSIGLRFANTDQRKLLETIGGLAFPSKRVEVYFKWHLKDYTDFKELPRIAKLLGAPMDYYGNAAAQLLDFEFAEGKTCRLVTECNKKGVFKTWFNTETDADLVILREFLKKLKVAKKS